MRIHICPSFEVIQPKSFFHKQKKTTETVKKQANFQENSKFHGSVTAKLQISGMQNFQDTFETRQ